MVGQRIQSSNCHVDELADISFVPGCAAFGTASTGRFTPKDADATLSRRHLTALRIDSPSIDDDFPRSVRTDRR
jgi:hypothetical protein